MKCLILAAGYATRLYPLTKDRPKPLLEVKGKTILDWLIDDIRTSGQIDEFIVVTNHRFAEIFTEWAKDRDDIRIVDDLTETNETRRGAVCDIEYAIEERQIDDDLLVIAGDNVLDFSLCSFIDYALAKKTSCTMRYHETVKEKLQRSGVSIIDENERLLELEEKPLEPKSEWCTPPFYIYLAEDVKKIRTAIAEGCATDAPGSLAAWMCRNSIVHSMEMPGKRYDIGNLESYRSVQETYEGIRY
ncbi:MAG: NTP transferase domain-containing protein [Erysipelotrichaceae bacterium]|nr:NTP transferase domain-containing protein [Erysipelotrichaceae bacterium]